MPGDLRDPEQFQQWHYDPRYDATPNMFDPGAEDTDRYLQSIAMETLGVNLNKEKLSWLKEKLSLRGLFSLNPGDEAFRQEVRNLLMVRKAYARSK